MIKESSLELFSSFAKALVHTGVSPDEIPELANMWYCNEAYQMPQNATPPQPTFTPIENAVIAIYSQFKEDYQILIDNGYMQKSKDGIHLQWLKSKQCLAEYFGYQHKESGLQTKISWKEIENLFQIEKIKHLFSKNGNTFKKDSKDYEALLTLKHQNLTHRKIF